MATRQTRSASYGNRKAVNGNVRRSTYIQGNAVRRLDYDVVEEIKKQPLDRVSQQARQNRQKESHMSLGTIAFYLSVMCVAAAVLCIYINMQSANTVLAREISTLENQVNSLKLENDETYSRIMSSVNMEEIKANAIGNLGMQYAQEGQIVTVEKAANDYVHQYIDMP